MTRNIKIRGRRRRPGGFLELETVDFDVLLPRGGSFEASHEVVKVADAAAVLAYLKPKDSFVLVRQPRVATKDDGPSGDGWLLELPAGRINGGETPRQCIRRELCEETGYNLSRQGDTADAAQLERFEPIATIYASPGYSRERIHIYYLELDDYDVREARVPVRPEYVETELFDPAELFRLLDARALLDPKLVIAANWYRHHKAARADAGVTTAAVLSSSAADAWPPRASEARPERYVIPAAVTGGTECIIGIIPGDIARAPERLGRPIDIWVNSENTDMQMDRFFGISVSAAIRRLGAEKSADGMLYRDTIAEALRRAMGGELFVKPGTIVVTEPGDLAEPPYYVLKLFHAAAVQGQPGRGLTSDPVTVAHCLTNAIERVVTLNADARWWHPLRARRQVYRSMLVPLLGTGQGLARAEDVAAALVPAAVEALKRQPENGLRELYFSAYTDKVVGLLRQHLDALLTKAT